MEDVRRLMAEGRMLRSEEGQGRDTTMCGDPKLWVSDEGVRINLMVERESSRGPGGRVLFHRKTKSVIINS